jgi:hypothetical protein
MEIEMKVQTKTFMSCGAAVLCGLAFFGLATVTVDGTPEGFVDIATGKCVAVSEKGKFRPCRENDRYETVMVAPGVTLEELKEHYSK